MSDPRDSIEPDPQQDADAIADEQYVHGLLDCLDPAQEQDHEQRIDRLMGAIRAEGAPAAPAAAPVDPARGWRVGLGVAASLAAIALVWLEWPRERDPADGTTAAAPAQLVMDSIAASQEAHRRYRIEAELPGDPQSGPVLVSGQLDLDARGDFVIHQGDGATGRAFAGSNAHGTWLIGIDGIVEAPHDRPDVDGLGPRAHWLHMHGSALLMDHLDRLLEAVHEEYDLEHLEPRTLPGHGAMLFRVIDARQPDAGDPRPDRMRLWLHPGSSLLQRLELHWESTESFHGSLQAHGLHGGAHGGGAHHEGGAQEHDVHVAPLHGALHPRFLHEDPDFDSGAVHPPLSMIFDLVDQPHFDESWFSAETHLP